MTSGHSSLHLLIASAGSGKTERTAQEALASLMQNKPVLAITFTRKAAMELHQRILSLATRPDHPPHLIKNLLFDDSYLLTGTIDSLIRQIYQHTAPFLGLPVYQDLIVEGADILQAQQQLLRSLWKKLSHKRHYAALRQAIHTYQSENRLSLTKVFRKALWTLLGESPIRLRLLKSLLTGPAPVSPHPKAQLLLENATETAGKFVPDFITKELYSILEELLRLYRQESRTLFLTDLQYVVELVALNAPPLVGLPYRHIRHLLLDEAQDTSLRQWRILSPLMEELRGSGQLIHIVGDPKQSIYAWRQADLRYFLGLQHQAHTTFLPANYRSQRRIVSYNNAFYLRLLKYIQSLAQQAKIKNDLHKITSAAYIQEVYKHHRQKPSRKKISPFGNGASRTPLLRVRGYTSSADLGRLLRRALILLKKRGIPSNEIAFLVRSNKDITYLRQLLPEYNLQVTSYELGRVPSLYAVMDLLALFQISSEALEGSPQPVSRLFLEYHGLYAPFVEVFLRGPLPETPLAWWKAFHALSHVLRQNLPAESLFWEAFLDRLWDFLEGQVAPTLPAILTWWEEKGAEIAVEVPLTPDTYPVLTIHKAKGLAWDAVIIPFANWKLFDYKASHKWYTLSRVANALDLSSSERDQLQDIVENLVGFPPGAGIAYDAELPLQINKGRGNDPSAPLYAEDYATAILENLNLHYVATTRPRQALFIYYEVSEEKPRAASDGPKKSRATSDGTKKSCATSDGPDPSFPSTWNQLHKRLQNKTL